MDVNLAYFVDPIDGGSHFEYGGHKKLDQGLPKSYGRDPSEVDIKDHLDQGTQSDDVSWLNLVGIFKVIEFFFKEVMLVEPIDANKYNYMLP